MPRRNGASPRMPRRRRRKTTLASALKEARKAGAAVSAATIEDGKVTLTFGEPTTSEKRGNDLDEWIVKHADKTQRH